MNRNSVFTAAVLCLTVFGCASSSLKYFPPLSLETPENELTLNESFETVWDRMVKNLSADFFVINNIEKASRLINVSFSASDPSQYLDCGRARRTFNDGSGERLFAYKTASSTDYLVADTQGRPFHIQRRTNLEGRSNIYVESEGVNTIVHVNTRYIFDVNVKTYMATGQIVGNEGFRWTFNTKEVFEKSEPQYNLVVKCVATGALEKKILSAAR